MLAQLQSSATSLPDPSGTLTLHNANHYDNYEIHDNKRNW
jgi:hypothetical protein